MVHRISKALLPTEEHESAFQRLCNNQINELRAHKEQLANVEKTKDLKDDDPNKYQPYPAPGAHPDVMNSVVPDGDDWNIDYEIFDEEEERKKNRTLEEKKNDLTHQLNLKAVKLQEKIHPARKRMMLSIEVQAIHNEISEAVGKHIADSQVKGQALTVEEASIKRQEFISRIPDEKKKKLDHSEKIGKKFEAILFHLAKMQDVIHDLDEKNIDSWKPEAFPEIER